jgi:hypothetical protein
VAAVFVDGAGQLLLPMLFGQRSLLQALLYAARGASRTAQRHACAPFLQEIGRSLAFSITVQSFVYPPRAAPAVAGSSSLDQSSLHPLLLFYYLESIRSAMGMIKLIDFSPMICVTYEVFFLQHFP